MFLCPSFTITRDDAICTCCLRPRSSGCSDGRASHPNVHVHGCSPDLIVRPHISTTIDSDRLQTNATRSRRVLVNFSVPFVSEFYFLSASFSGDTIRFGIWGFCHQQSGQCTSKTLGYHLDPEITFWLTKVLVLFPIGTICKSDAIREALLTE